MPDDGLETEDPHGEFDEHLTEALEHLRAARETDAPLDLHVAEMVDEAITQTLGARGRQRVQKEVYSADAD